MDCKNILIPIEENNTVIDTSDAIIRQAIISDYVVIQKICQDDLGYNCSADLVKERLKSLDSNRERVFVADIDGKVVGFVHAEKYNTLYFENMVNIQGLAVAKGYRRNGFGKALMNTVEAWANECDIRMIRLNSGIARKEAHEFYRSVGYDNEKEQIRFLKKL